MIRFKGLWVRNRLLFKDAHFNLDQKGLSVILGDNRHANHGSTNAAGKSRLFGFLPEILAIEPPLVKKREKYTKGFAAVEFEKGDHAYRVAIKGVADREQVVIKRDNDDKQVRTKTRAIAVLEKLIDHTEEEFYSLVYIDSRRPNPLHMGSTAARRQFIVNMFRLSNVDNVRKLFAAELRRIGEDRQVYEEVKRQYRSLADQMIDESEESLASRVEHLEKLYKSLSERVHKAASKESLLEFKHENERDIRRLLKMFPNGFDTYEQVTVNLESQLRECREHLMEAKEWTKHVTLMDEYKRVAKPLKKKFAKFNLLIDEAEKGAKRYSRTTQELREVKELIAYQKTHLPDKLPVDEELASVNLDEVIAKISNFKSLLSTAEKFEDGKCPLCGGHVKAHDPKVLRKKLSKLEDYAAEVKSARFNKETMDKRAAARVLIKAKLKELTEVRRIREKYERHEEAYSILLAIPQKPEPFTGKQYEEEDYREEISRIEKRLAFMDSMKQSLDRVTACMKLEEEDKQEVANLPDMRAKLDKIVAKLPLAKSSLDKMRTVKSGMAELKARALELKESVKDEEAYKLLVEAYGNSGIKKLMVQRIGTHLEGCLNRYAKFAFSEPYQFKVRIDTQFDILVKRKYEDRTDISDVRKLSGAESRAFTLLLYLSLLSLIPESRRTNILILDEPEIGMGPEMLDNLKRFLPVLNKIVPHIILITPQSQIDWPSARVYTVVKEKGYSRIIQGRTQSRESYQ